MKRERFEKGLTVAELKRVIADWPETDDQGEPCEVWLADARGASNQACTISPLNARTSEDGKHSWADLILQHDA